MKIPNPPGGGKDTADAEETEKVPNPIVTLSNHKQEYDGNRNVIKVTNQLCKDYTYSFDLLGRLTKAVTPSGTATQYNYDKIGNMTSMTDPSGNVTKYGYDPANRLVSLIDELGGVTSYQYDATGNMISMTDANYHQKSWEYNLEGQVTKETNPLGDATSYTYDPSGNLAAKVRMNIALICVVRRLVRIIYIMIKTKTKCRPFVKADRKN